MVAQAVKTLRFATDLDIFVARRTEDLSSSSGTDLSFALQQVERFVVGQHQLVQQLGEDAKALFTRQVVDAVKHLFAEGGLYLDLQQLLKLDSLLAGYGQRHPELNHSIGALVLEHYAELRRIAGTPQRGPGSSFSMDQWSKLLAWSSSTVSDHYGPTATISSDDAALSSPQLGSEADTSSVSSGPSLSSFEGSEATAETAPDMLPG